MRVRGCSDYASGIPTAHPFYQKCPKLQTRNLAFLGIKNRRWQWLTSLLLVILLCNVLFIFWLSSARRPVVYVGTILKSGHFYQVGVLNRPPLDKEQSGKVLVTHGIKIDSHTTGGTSGKSDN